MAASPHCSTTACNIWLVVTHLRGKVDWLPEPGPFLVRDDGSVSVRWSHGPSHVTMWFRVETVSWEAKADGRRTSQGVVRFLNGTLAGGEKLIRAFHINLS